MIEVEMCAHEVDSNVDLWTIGLGPCVGVVVGYNGRVSMYHAPMPNAGDNSFFDALDASIPHADRSDVHPILAGCHTSRTSPDKDIMQTRLWVENKLSKMGFGASVVMWGYGSDIASHSLRTSAATGEVELEECVGGNRVGSQIIRLW